MTDTKMVDVDKSSKLLESKFGNSENIPTKITESEAYKLVREINESKKGKAVVSEGKLVVKELIVG